MALTSYTNSSLGTHSMDWFLPSLPLLASGLNPGKEYRLGSHKCSGLNASSATQQTHPCTSLSFCFFPYDFGVSYGMRSTVQ